MNMIHSQLEDWLYGTPVYRVQRYRYRTA